MLKTIRRDPAPVTATAPVDKEQEEATPRPRRMKPGSLLLGPECYERLRSGEWNPGHVALLVFFTMAFSAEEMPTPPDTVASKSARYDRASRTIIVTSGIAHDPGGVFISWRRLARDLAADEWLEIDWRAGGATHVREGRRLRDAAKRCK